MTRDARWPSVALLAVVAAGASADDAAEAPAPPTVRLAAGTTYRFRYVEKATLRVPADRLRLENMTLANGEVDGAEPGAQVGRRATWDVAIRLVETKDDASLVVSLLVGRVHGDASAGRTFPPPAGVDVQPIPEMKFDSDVPCPLPPSYLAGRALTVRLAPNARVIEATPVPQAAPAPGVAAPAERIKPAAAVEFAQRFFQQLPTTPLRVKGTWDAPRPLAPELGFPVGRAQDLGTIVETATLDQWLQGVVVAKLAAKKADVAAPAAATPKAAGPWKRDVREATLVGAASIDRATGLARSRTTTVHVEARREGFTVPAKTVVIGPGESRVFPAEIVPEQEETYDLETRLELIEAR